MFEYMFTRFGRLQQRDRRNRRTDTTP